MDELTRIQGLLRLSSTDIDKVSREIGVSRRTLYLIKAGRTNITLTTLNKLRAWAKGKRLPADSTTSGG